MIRIYAPQAQYVSKAEKLRDHLMKMRPEGAKESFELMSGSEQPDKTERYLRLDEKGLTLVEGKLELRGDFRQMLPRVRGGHLQHEKLLRAARRKKAPGRGQNNPLALDATAGLGEDSFILASGGYSVVLCEYNPVIAALLGDALERTRHDPDLAETAGRMELIPGDSIDLLTNLERRPELIYLDPMFPAKQKSGISKKKLQLFQRLETPCAREEELMAAALAAGPDRIVVKRPVKGHFLAGRKASHSIDCKNVRFDCYVLSGR